MWLPKKKRLNNIYAVPVLEAPLWLQSQFPMIVQQMELVGEPVEMGGPNLSYVLSSLKDLPEAFEEEQDGDTLFNGWQLWKSYLRVRQDRVNWLEKLDVPTETCIFLGAWFLVQYVKQTTKGNDTYLLQISDQGTLKNLTFRCRDVVVLGKFATDRGFRYQKMLICCDWIEDEKITPSEDDYMALSGDLGNSLSRKAKFWMNKIPAISNT